MPVCQAATCLNFPDSFCCNVLNTFIKTHIWSEGKRVKNIYEVRKKYEREELDSVPEKKAKLLIITTVFVFTVYSVFRLFELID